MRLFLALELTRRTRSEIGEASAAMRRELEGWKWIRSESVHVTLRFLDEVSEARDAGSRALWGRAVAARSAFRFRIGGVGCFPPRGRPRTLWLGIEEPTGSLVTLQSALEEAASGFGFDSERRPFRGHVTLARSRSGVRATRPDPEAVSRCWDETAGCVVLFRSTTDPRGARYTALETFPFADSQCGR